MKKSDMDEASELLHSINSGLIGFLDLDREERMRLCAYMDLGHAKRQSYYKSLNKQSHGKTIT